MKINQLLAESTNTQDNVDSRPSLLSLTRATTKLIYQDLVAIQPTKNNVAALFGVKYLNPNNTLSFITGATYSGQFGKADRQSLPEFTGVAPYTKGTFFKYNDIVFKVLVDNPFNDSTETDLNDLISEAVIDSTIRLVPDAADPGKFETGGQISDAKFSIRKWQAKVKPRKFQSEISVELAQDMESNGFKTPEMIEDLLATQMAEEINKDIMQSLMTVSSRFKVRGVSDKGVLDLSNSSTSSVERARTLYNFICEMNASIQRNTAYSATYVMASSRVAALLTASGWMEKQPDQPYSAYGVLKNGLVLYCDNNSPVEYVVVGVKDDLGEKETIGSLFYAPYVEGLSDEADMVDHIGAYKLAIDPDSLQPKLMLMVRYALCVNPYTMGLNDTEAKLVDSTNLDNFAGKSQMSVMLGVKLPKLDI